MNIVPSSMSSMLASRSKDLLVGIEFYESTYTPNVTHGFEPDNAIALFATETVPVYIFRSGIVVDYVRSVFEMPSLTRSMGKQSNSVTVKISNIPQATDPTVQPIASFVLNNEIEGMRMVIRLLSRANLTVLGGAESFVLFVGRCQRQDGFDRQAGTITAKQDLGQIEAVIPPRVFQKDCPLRFKGEECLGTELEAAKDAAYQAATVCNKTFGQCTDYGNTEFFQGIRVVQIQGSFIHRPHEGFFAKLIGLLTPGSGKRRKTVGSSIEDGTPYGQVIPVVLGRWRMPGIPLQFQDIGTSINFLIAWARGPITAAHNITNLTPGFTQPISVTTHLGEYGGVGSQTADTVFPEHGFFSRLAYSTGYVNGSDIAVEEPAPDIAAMIAGFASNEAIQSSVSSAGEGCDEGGTFNFISSSWSDNPVNLTLAILLDTSLLNLPLAFIDQYRSAKTSYYCDGGIKDVTNAERLVLPNTQTASAGVDFKRYNTTGLIYGTNPPFTSTHGTPGAGAAHEVDYEFYDPNSPPTSTALKTFYRKRFTANIALTEQKKVLDFIYDTLLPTFRGFFSWDTHGRLGVRSERPADPTNVRSASIVTATTIKVNDVFPWKKAFNDTGNPLVGKVLIGVGLDTSEVRSVNSAAYSADGNSVTLAVSTTGSGSIVASGGTLSGGSSSVAASATITFNGTSFAQDDEVTATIDGVDITYTVGRNENTASIAPALAIAINADPVIGKYVVAHCAGGQNNPITVVVECKYGVLTLSSALVEAHDVDEEIIRVMMSFASSALTYADCTKSNIFDGTFKYLGSDGQTRFNQFKGTFHDPLRDFAEQPVIINDYDHQDQIQKIQPLEIDLAAVDSYNQASRLLNGAAAKFGDGVDFFSLSSNGLALQLEEGDRICVSHYAGEFRNVPLTIESLTLNSKFEISFKGRVYSTSMYNDEVIETDVPLVSGLVNSFEGPPDISFNTVDFPTTGLVQATDGSAGITSIRGGVIFGDSVYQQYGKIRLIRRAGITVDESINDHLAPDADGEGVFEFVASLPGLYRVQAQACNQWGCSTAVTADITISFASLENVVVNDILVAVNSIQVTETI